MTRYRTSYRSVYEARVADFLEEAGISYQYERDRLVYVNPGVYTPDFTLPGGVLIEAKGYFPLQDRKKMLCVKQSNPTADIRILLQTPNKKIGKGPASMTYAKWCCKHGFPWAEGPEVPLDWLGKEA